MTITYDNVNTVAKFKIYEYLGTIFNLAINENGDGESIFRLTGISSLINNYTEEITPYIFNGTWKNPHPQYSPKKVFLEIITELDDKHKFLFIKNIIEHANFHKYDEFDDYNEDMRKLSDHLAILGYSLIKSNESYSEYTIKQTSTGLIERAKDISLLEQTIKNNYSSLYKIYDEALSTFGNGEYKSCIDNCRTLYEKITQALTSNGTDKAALILSKETILDDTGTEITSKDKIYKYWIDKKKGANRYRYFTTLYSVMSGLGPHGEEEPSRSDAIMILRALEDVLGWMLMI